MASEITYPTPIDRVEARMLAAGAEVRRRGGGTSFAPVRHRFTPGLYIRELFMPTGAIITSEIHKTHHPYVVSQGSCLVFLENEGRWERIDAPYTGITLPSTRRLLYIVRDTIWTTFHPTQNTTVKEVEEEIFYPRNNPLFEYEGDIPRLRDGGDL